MSLPKKEIKISVILDYYLLNKIITSISNKIDSSKIPEDFPQIDFLNKLKMPRSMAGIFFSKEEYDAYLKPFLSKEERQIEFDTFVRGLLNREGDSKRIFLRSSFLERIDENSAIQLKNIFLESGFSFSFQIIIESPVSLFLKDFFSLFYQIPTNFTYSKPESFFQNIFKEKLKKVFSGLKILSKVFGRGNITYIYDENFPTKDFQKSKIFSFYEELDIQNYFLNYKNEERFEINPLFLEYIRCKLLEGDININEEVLQTRKIAQKFKLKSPFSYKDMSSESVKELEKFSEQLTNLLPENQKPVKNFLFINTETCSLKHVIPFVKNNKPN
jgi:hypothetical protein